jgi:ABC-type glutathione transport system ATPase component
MSWRLPPGAIHGWVGESGAGKTTFARVLAGLERPRRGQVALDGQPVDPGRPSPAFRRSVAYLPQDPGATLDPRWTVRAAIEEALAAGGRLADDFEAATRAILEAVGLEAELADRRPPSLSGGQRQRAGWARALAIAPRYLILDEPLTALDPPRARALEALILRQRDRGVGVLLVSHDLATVFRCASEVGVLWRGRLVERGPAEALREQPRHPYTGRLWRGAPPAFDIGAADR